MSTRHFGNNGGHHTTDTALTKIFVGGLAWETHRDAMRAYFDQFGDILEAVVIADKNTGRSKGYGFVTFKDPESAMRACQNPSPVIDGRRANCNLASLGARKPRPATTTPQHGRFRAPQAYNSNQSSASTYFHQPAGQHYHFPYSAYSYGGYSQDSMNPMSYYGVYGGQQFSPYYHNYYPYYAQNSQAHLHQQQHHLGYNLQFLQFPYSNSTGILSLPSSVPTISAAPITGTEAANVGPTVSQAASSNPNSSSN